MKFYLLLLLTCSRAHARIQSEWELLRPDEELHWDTSLGTDEYRLYLGHWAGLYISVDLGYTWRLTLPDREIASGLLVGMLSMPAHIITTYFAPTPAATHGNRKRTDSP